LGVRRYNTTLIRVRVGSLVRLSRFERNEPYFGTDALGRFDDPKKRFGVCYAADSLETAFAETLLNRPCDRSPGQTPLMVSLSDAMSRHCWTFSRCRHGEELVLINLTGPALKALCGNNDISAGKFEVSQAWARELFVAEPGADGLLYVSRQNNMRTACALFRRSRLSGGQCRKLTETEVIDLCSLYGAELLPDEVK